MRIKWILNNNAVICDDKNGIEKVIKGKGIAFGLKKGDVIDPKKIERIFEISEKEIQRRYQEVLLTIPEDCIDISEEIIDMIKNTVDQEISDSIYITLTDHISNLMERLQMGIVFDDFLLWDVKHLYPKEYLAGQEAVKIIENRFHVHVRDDEASFIALHIVNAELDGNMNHVIETTKLVEDISDIVVSDFGLELNKESLAYSRFLMHLRVFMERIVKDEVHKSESNNEIIIESLKKSYPQQFDTTIKIINYISKRFDINYNGEVLYLLIHIIKITNEGIKGGEV